MKIGRTTKEKREKHIKSCKWHCWFAWHPVQLEDGRYAWFERVMRKNVIDNYNYSCIYIYEPYIPAIGGLSKLKESCDSVPRL